MKSDEEPSSDKASSTKDEPDEPKSDASSDNDRQEESEESPEPYTLAAPDGYSVNQDAVNDFSEFASKYGVPEKEAQSYLNNFVQQQQEQLTEALESTLENWGTQLKEDKELGGEKYEENMAIARKAVEAYGGEKLVKALEETGVGSHPEIVRSFWRVGKDLQNDSVGSAGEVNSSSAKSEENQFAKLYPSMMNKGDN